MSVVIPPGILTKVSDYRQQVDVIDGEATCLSYLTTRLSYTAVTVARRRVIFWNVVQFYNRRWAGNRTGRLKIQDRTSMDKKSTVPE